MKTRFWHGRPTLPSSVAMIADDSRDPSRCAVCHTDRYPRGMLCIADTERAYICVRCLRSMADSCRHIHFGRAPEGE